ncbi:coiled-coil domain-containing protein 190 isoform X1 [Lutra lutra]|uniref:coiled-coil domain-containing protein 190 isoform X1 n=1 Tax=Lutra lutra TaxID=9657 RepID=UPI001FD62B56|nr:coiled-coil domain-containing protein 190 isoform X1 [Lutra lutra]XP_047560955.1 coiled-coil domain-containing protein 190 isoform X1 [Lutra lutra]
MKRMERHMVTGPVYKHFDLERKNARRAEARLRQRLHTLEYICLYQMKLLTWEQRQLQEELLRLQQADIIKKKLSSYLGNGIQKKPKDVLPPSSTRGQKHQVPQVNKVRALVTNMTQEIHKTKSQMPPFHHTALKNSMKSKEESLFQNYRASRFTAEKPRAREKDCQSPTKGKASSKGISVLCQDQDVSINTLDQGPGSSPAGESGKPHIDEAGSKDASLQPDSSAGRQSPLNPRECAGYVKDEPVTPTFLELFVKVRNAHYLRHRVPPESERLLSIGEIFDHKESFQPRGGQECENRAGFLHL